MTISYNWLSEYLPVKIEPERLSRVLTSIGLEVESMQKYESMRGSLKGLVIGEVLSIEKHPNADKLKITTVNTGGKTHLQIVCGAANVAASQKVVVAPVGSTIYPFNGDPITMKVATIRGIESQGMICAEDEIGLGENHEGIMVLPADQQAGIPLATYFQPYEDIIYEIGLTPNRMDAMSHMGVARDVCAYLTHHDKKSLRVKSPFVNAFKTDNNSIPIRVTIENTEGCQRYAGISIKGVSVAPSPIWLQNKLKSIGQRPINNIVDITNFILHETGQPLHAFDADAIKGRKIIVRNLPEGTPFTTLDEKQRSLSAQDLMICDAEEPVCIAGVFGGLHSGVKSGTTNVFLESAWFNPTDIRRTSFRHNLRTDAAAHFEKGVDISNTVNVLKRAALLIRELTGGQLASEIVDIYPAPRPKTEVALKYHYLKKLSGKNYHQDAIRKILEALGFEMIKEGIDEMRVNVPYSKPDISLPADIVEEILRIDGYDNIEIPTAISITPSVEDNGKSAFKEKVTGYLTGAGFSEIMTNSITNSAYFSEDVLQRSVSMLNSLSAELNIMRPSMLETGLQAVSYNLNRRNNNLQFFEFGKTYSTSGPGRYEEHEHLCLYATGKSVEDGWKNKEQPADFYFIKGVMSAITQLLGTEVQEFTQTSAHGLGSGLRGAINLKPVVELGIVSQQLLDRFDIRQPVVFADLNWDELMNCALSNETRFAGLPSQIPVKRDLAVIVPKSLPYMALEETAKKINLSKLQNMQLFDIFESEKLGNDKKSMAISFNFLDRDKTMTDAEIDGMMNQIMSAFQRELKAEIRK